MKPFIIGCLILVGCIGTIDLSAKEHPIALAIHGGAGTITPDKMTPEKEKAIRAKLTEALNAGYKILDQGGASLDAVIAAVNILEDSPLFNAGIGAVYTHDGTHELDASIMDGSNLQAGAVAGVKRIKNPINLARLVMDESVHVMLSGHGAEEFAQSNGIELVDNTLFDTPHRLEQLRRAQSKAKKQALLDMPVEYRVGTVGAVALDKKGNLAAATSTGGMTNKRYGRVGDSPIIGAGTYANNQSCAVSATGHGEFFIRYHVAADICARVQYQGLSIQEAGEKVINQVLKNAGATGGVIIVDAMGNVSLPFNTKGMYRGSKTSSSELKVSIYGTD